MLFCRLVYIMTRHHSFPWKISVNSACYLLNSASWGGRSLNFAADSPLSEN